MSNNQRNIATFGEFEEKMSGHYEYLSIGFSPNYTPLKKRWENNGLSADFIADYFRAFYISRYEENGKDVNDFDVENMCIKVKYIANELLENAMKFQDAEVPYTAKVYLFLRAEKLMFRVTNAIQPEQADILQAYIRKLLAGDPQELFLAAMHANFKAKNKGRSGLGFLSMVCDYGAKLGWQFAMTEESEGEQSFMTVTTMVTLDT